MGSRKNRDKIGMNKAKKLTILPLEGQHLLYNKVN